MFLLFRKYLSKHATKEIPIFELVSVAVEIVLGLALSETTKTGFVVPMPNYNPVK